MSKVDFRQVVAKQQAAKLEKLAKASANLCSCGKREAGANGLCLICNINADSKSASTVSAPGSKVCWSCEGTKIIRQSPPPYIAMKLSTNGEYPCAICQASYYDAHNKQEH